jgi:hypothetical protein
MSRVSNPPTSDEASGKAKARSISFTDDSLYTWARAFGRKLSPKQSASLVVCTALKEFKERNEPTTDEAQLIVAARKVGISKALAAIASLRRPSKRTVPTS